MVIIVARLQWASVAACIASFVGRSPCHGMVNQHNRELRGVRTFQVKLFTLAQDNWRQLPAGMPGRGQAAAGYGSAVWHMLY